jgi:hypothetical protein
LAFSFWPAMSTVTPLGNATGYLPIRDIVCSVFLAFRCRP